MKKGLKKLFWIDKEYDSFGGSYIGMFDLAKGLAMMGIILSHCVNHYYSYLTFNGGDTLLSKVLWSPMSVPRFGYVPMLFMICGYGFRKQSVKKNIKHNLKLFAGPYFLVTLGMLLTVLAKQVIRGGSLIWRLRHDVLPFLIGFNPGFHRIGSFMSQIGPIWFFWTYIFGSIYLNIICQEKRQELQIMMIFIGSVFAVSGRGIVLPFCFQQIIICSGFMYAGMCMKKGHFTQKRLPRYMTVLIYAACLIAAAQEGLPEISNNIYALGLQDLAVAYLAGILMVYGCRKLDVCRGILTDGIRWIGRHMLWICCFHTIAYLAVPWEKVALWFGNQKAMGIVIEFIFNFVYAVAASVVLEKLLKYRMVRKRRNM